MNAVPTKLIKRTASVTTLHIYRGNFAADRNTSFLRALKSKCKDYSAIAGTKFAEY